MTAPSPAVIRYGTDEPPAGARILRAGDLSAEFAAGNLRYIRYGGREAIRAISYVTRDEFWGTDNPSIRDLRIDESRDSFTVTYSATCARETESFTYHARITGTPTSLRFEASGAGDTDFLTCRTGFVVLHGVEGIVGHPVTVEHVDGRVVDSVFPEVIDPDCPFRDIRALSHAVAPGVTVRCEMTGDTFEMEDQRNWTDASYKTYVRPLALPKPYRLAAGEVVEQAVELTFAGPAPAAATGGQDVTVSVGAPAGRLPRIGMWVDAADLAAAETRLDALDPLRPAFLSCYLDTTRVEAGPPLAKLGSLAARLAAPLALEVVVPGDDPRGELAAVAGAAANAGLAFREVAVSRADDMEFVQPGTVFPDMTSFEELYAAARGAFPDARIGGGNFVYFTELNRKPVPADRLDFVMHGTSALVHAADDRSVTETLECLPFVFASMRARYGSKPYRVGPAGIGSRTSPFGNDPTPNPHASRVTMTNRDPRQRGLLGAAWHLGYVAHAAASGVDSLALGTPTGGFGLVHAPGDFEQPWFDEVGGRFPVFHVMRGMYAASGAERLATEVSAPGEVQALAFASAGGPELWIANLTPEERWVAVDGFDVASVASIDERTFTSCASDATALDSTAPAAGQRIRVTAYSVLRLTP